MTDPDGPSLSDRVRSAVESRAGDRRRDHRHGVLSRVRLPHRRRVPRRARSRSTRDCTDRRPICDPLIGERRRADAPRHRQRAAPRRPAAEWQLPRARQPVRRRQAARATSATTARAPTTPTTSCRTSIAASCARRACFGAWLNHDDSRGVNSLDMLVSGRTAAYVKHYMFDFGSILGSGTVYAAASSRRQRVHPRVEARLADAGDARPLHATLDAHRLSGRARRRSAASRRDAFDPERWKPEYPNPAFDNMRPDDAFWAARIVAQFSDDAIRAIVEKAQYSDPRATDYIDGDADQAARQGAAHAG